MILLDDLLEHLKNPINFLVKIHSVLNNNGYIICSIHNTSYITIRLHMLNGNCFYDLSNTLNKTNRYLYTLDDILLLLNKANFRITTLQRITQKFDFRNNTDIQYASFPDDLINSFAKDPESETFKFIFKAKPESLVDLHTREYLLNNFPKNYVTEELKRRIDDYIKNIQYYTQQIQLLENTITSYTKQINEIKNSKIWKIARLIDKFRK